MSTIRSNDSSLPAQIPPSPRIPPLEPGDRLSREEFERRFDAMPGLKKAELLEGIVHMPSPVRLDQNAVPRADFIGWLVFYRAFTTGVRVSDNGTVRLDLDNEPQPDAAMIVLPSYGGMAEISEDDYIEGAPELVGEVSSSTVSIDLNTKFRVYRRNKVQEYVVWRVLDWFVLRKTDYQRLSLSDEGFYKSEVFPGLWLDPAALIRLDLARVLQVAEQGMASPEHAAFKERLLQRREAP